MNQLNNIYFYSYDSIVKNIYPLSFKPITLFLTFENIKFINFYNTRIMITSYYILYDFLKHVYLILTLYKKINKQRKNYLSVTLRTKMQIRKHSNDNPS